MDVILKALEKVLPTATLALIFSFLWIQEKRMKELRDEKKELRDEKKEQRESYESQIKALTEEKNI